MVLSKTPSQAAVLVNNIYKINFDANKGSAYVFEV